MGKPKFITFRAFWPYYLGEHRRSGTRILHFFGTLTPLLLIPLSLITRRVWLLLLWPLISYLVAWFSHFVVERNKPATWNYPLYSLMADYKMCGLMITGKLGEELDRLKVEKVSTDG